MTKVSVVIYTKDNPEKVIKLHSKLRNFFDDIVIIDSSNPQNFRKIYDKIGGAKNARIFNLPPLGIVEPYHKIGAQLVKHKWILHLDDDEVPSNELINYLINDFNPKKTTAAYMLLRVEVSRNFVSRKIRLYNKNKVSFSGIIHWGIIPDGYIEKLNKKIIHYEQPNYQKWKKYALLDSYMIGYKILWIIKNKKWHPYDKKYKKSAEIFGFFINKIINKGYIGWIFALLIYSIIAMYYGLTHGGLKDRFRSAVYYIILISYVFGGGVLRKIKIWEILFNNGLNKFIRIDKIEDFEKLKMCNKSGLSLLITLLEKNIRQS